MYSKVNKCLFTSLITATLLVSMTLHSVQANTNNDKVSQIKQSLEENASFQDFNKLGNMNIDLNSMKQDNLIQISHELSNYISSYDKVQNDIKNDKNSKIMHLLADYNVQDVKQVQPMVELAKNVQNDLQNTSCNDDKSKANIIRKTLMNGNIQAIIDFNNGSFDDSSRLINHLNDLNDRDIINFFDKSSQFLNSYQTIQNDNDYQSTQLKPLIKKINGFNVYDKDNNVVIKLGNDLYTVANNLKDIEIQPDDDSQASKVKSILKKNSIDSFAVKGSHTINISDINDGNVSKVINKLSDYVNNYQKVQNNIKDSIANDDKFNLSSIGIDNLDNLNNDQIINKVKYINNIANDINNVLYRKGYNVNRDDIASKTKEILQKDSINQINFNGIGVISPSKLNTDDTVELYNNLSSFSDNGIFQNEQDDLIKNKNKQLKPLLFNNDKDNLSNLNDDQIIQYGNNLNKAANEIKNAFPSNNNSNVPSNIPSSNVVISTPSSNVNTKTNNNDSNYTVPKINDASKEASFPTVPSTSKKRKYSSKELKKTRINIKKNKKRLKKIKNQLRKAKGKVNKIRLNKKLKHIKKVLSYAKIKYNKLIKKI